MRRKFAELLHREMKSHDNIDVVTADMGYKMFDEVEKSFPDRFYNVGAAEQLMLGMCVGLAISGKIAIAYSITPFLLYRPFEWIRNYLNHDGIPVKLVGSGRDQDYSHDGFTHWAHDDFPIMECFSRIDKYWPENQQRTGKKIRGISLFKKPCVLKLEEVMMKKIKIKLSKKEWRRVANLINKELGVMPRK